MSELTDLGRKRIPAISVPDHLKARETFEVTVEVGKLLTHPKEPAHFIDWVDLYTNWVFLARISLSAATTRPDLKVPVTMTHSMKQLTFRAFERCKLHGVWKGTREVSID